LGQTDFISGLDLLRLSRHYNCPGAWSAEALEKARTTIFIPREDGTIVEERVDSLLAEDLELIDDQDV
jgi:hypothetical protein